MQQPLVKEHHNAPKKRKSEKRQRTKDKGGEKVITVTGLGGGSARVTFPGFERMGRDSNRTGKETIVHAHEFQVRFG